MKYKKQDCLKNFSIVFLCFLFAHTWFFFPKQMNSAGRVSFSMEVILLYGRLCQLPSFFAQEVLSALPKEKKSSRTSGTRQLHLFWLLLSLPVLIFALFFQRRSHRRGQRDTAVEPDCVKRGDF